MLFRHLYRLTPAQADALPATEWDALYWGGRQLLGWDEQADETGQPSIGGQWDERVGGRSVADIIARP